MRPKGTLKTSGNLPAAAIIMALKSANVSVKPSASPLTAAENRVLALVIQAKTNKEIARDLSISPATVKRHLENVLSELGLRNRVQTAIYGILVAAVPVKLVLLAHCKHGARIGRHFANMG